MALYKITRFLFIAIFVITAQVGFSQVQQDCGALDCPGRCGRFIDQNGDGFCDHGRVSAPAKPVEETVIETPIIEATPKKAEKAETPAKKTEEQHKCQEGTCSGEHNCAHHEGCHHCNHAEVEDPETAAVPTETEEPAEPVKTKSPYSLILISSLTLGLYLISFILVKANVWKKATHRKVWNILLLITGLVSCLLGFFLVIQINYNLKMDWFWTVKVYHVQFGIAMTIVVVIHILWHMNYWKSIFRKK